MRTEPSRRHNRRYTQLKEALLPAGLVTFTLFLFGPFTIYFWNPGQLDSGYLSALTILAPLAFLAALVLLVPAYLLPSALFRFYNPLLLALGVALWLQGNVFVGSYGVLDGSEIDFAAQSWRVWPETLIWLGVPVLVIFLYGKRRETALFVARIVLVLEILHFGAGVVAYPGLLKNSGTNTLPIDLPVLSSRQNILQIVLDGFQSDAFLEVLERYPEWAGSFDGFVFFENSMGSFASTRMSIPAILSGRVYRNQVPMDEFISEVMADQTLPAELHRNGYLVDVVTLRQYRYGDNYASWYSIVRPFAAEGELTRFAAAEVLDLSLFRHLPHLLKPWVYRSQSWLIRSWEALKVSPDRQFHPSNAVAFMKHYRSRLRVGDAQPRYKFLHLMVPHLPLVLDGDCNFIEPMPESRAAYIEQSACAVRLLVDLFDDLRALGLYDDALIAISADHGNRFPSPTVSSRFDDANLVSNAAALMLIKPPGGRSVLARSKAPVSLSDIPATVSELAGITRDFPGIPALRVGQDDRRDRRYYHYSWKHLYWSYEFFPDFREYLVEGDIFDPEAWKFLGVVPPREEAPYSSYFRVDLGRAEDRKYLGAGWDEDDVHLETSYAFALGETASLTFPRIPKGDALLSARLAPAPQDRPQEITVFVEGRELTRWKAYPGGGWSVYSAVIPASDGSGGEVAIRFHFSDVVGPRKIAAAFDYVQIRPMIEAGARR